LGGGNNVVTLGGGNDNVQAGNGNNVITAGNGNDNVQVGGGNNTITLGGGNDNVQAGDGNNVIVTGGGNDNIHAGNGDNLIADGGGHDNVQTGNGNNILIDGSVRLTQPGDTLAQVLSDWMGDIQAHDTAAEIAALIEPRLAVTYNTTNPNTLHAGTGFDWFWAAYAKDNVNKKPGDLVQT
jgi:Ca2+-binding RTX toxin-like protein